MKLDRRWLLAPPLLAVVLATGPFAIDGGGIDGRTLAAAFAALAVVLAAITAITAWRARATPTAPVLTTGPGVQVRHAVRLAGGGRLLVVRFAGRDLLVAHGVDGSVRLLADTERGEVARQLAPEAIQPRTSQTQRDATRPLRTVEIPRPDPAPAERMQGFRALARAGR